MSDDLEHKISGSSTIAVTPRGDGGVGVTLIGSLGAPTTADYLVKTANGSLSAERVVTDTSTVAADWSVAGQVQFNVPNDSITFAKMQNVSGASKLLGRGSSGGSGDPEEITIGSNLSMSGTTLSATAIGENIGWFGSGVDGDVTISTGVTLTKDMNYNNLTFAAGGSINNNGYAIHVLGIADFTNADAGAITATGLNGGDAITNSAGASGAALWTTSHTVGRGESSGALGGQGQTGAGSQATAPSNPLRMAGGNGGAGGAGGSGSGGAGGASRGGSAGTVVYHGFLTRMFQRIDDSTVGMISGGCGGTGGSGGGGNGAQTGGGGGGWGGAGGTVALYAKTIKTGASTPAGVIQSKGGNGGAGATRGSGIGANLGGGGGGAGGGGGWIVVAYLTKDGSSVADIIDASGGNGGAGGDGNGTGTGGSGGTGGACGRIHVYYLGGGTVQSVAPANGTGGNGPTGTTGGTGGSGASGKVSL